ncbi:MAG: DUF3179 domain-containing (seleno)protein [Bacteroidota bacterium]
MRKLFFLTIFSLLLFECSNVYFIMPFPGSQEINSVSVAYFLYSWRWVFRSVLVIVLFYSIVKTKWKRKWTLSIPILFLAVICYQLNFKMAADALFKQVEKISFADAASNKVDLNRLVIGVVKDGVAKAYPINFLGYHHIVHDTINKQAILVTYCTVCRTGRVFDARLNGKVEQFRLVGMDHYNALIEDKTTKSWWQQSTGKAITGKLKGAQLKEVYASQTTLKKWLQLYPRSLIMQADEKNYDNYSPTFKYENGTSTGALTGTDKQSWKNKSWVIGVKIGHDSKVFDWNELLKKELINSKVGSTPIFIALSKDMKSFFAFENLHSSTPILKNDTIYLNNNRYTLNGQGIDTKTNLKSVYAYQEFWHSWNYFQNNKQSVRK